MGFFGLTPKHKEYTHQEVFTLIHYGKGFTFNDVYTMPLHLRKYYLEQIVKVAKEKEKAMKKARSNRT